MKHMILLQSPAPKKKKKLVASLLWTSHSSAMVCDAADFPDPAGPFNQQNR
jgi:hypothetical protein